VDNAAAVATIVRLSFVAGAAEVVVHRRRFDGGPGPTDCFRIVHGLESTVATAFSLHPSTFDSVVGIAIAVACTMSGLNDSVPLIERVVAQGLSGRVSMAAPISTISPVVIKNGTSISPITIGCAGVPIRSHWYLMAAGSVSAPLMLIVLLWPSLSRAVPMSWSFPA